jgi:3-hydroxyanthranilate 3,4-dioxygenase
MSPADEPAAAPPPRLAAFNIPAWLAANRHLLKPPVGNRLLYSGEFKVMVVAGPNARTDYHVECGEEWFYQLEGEMTLRVVHAGTFYDIRLAAGDTFCLPPGVPHSPQRAAGSIGIVIERERRPGEVDALLWYCQNEACREVLYREDFVCRDLGRDLAPIIEAYYADEGKRTCVKCRFKESPPT